MFECPMCECVFETRTVCPQCGVPTTEVVGQRLLVHLAAWDPDSDFGRDPESLLREEDCA